MFVFKMNKMNRSKALSVVASVASVDFNGEGCTEEYARVAVRNMAKPGYSSNAEAAEAVAVLGVESALVAYQEQWELDYMDEYGQDDAE